MTLGVAGADSLVAAGGAVLASGQSQLAIHVTFLILSF